MNKAQRVTGIVLQGLVALVMLFAGSGKAFGFAPPEIVQKMNDYGLGSKLVLIGGGELIAAILLLIPVTSSLGTLLTSGFWGGVICIHMAHSEDYLFPSALLAVTWVGALLRNPTMFSSFAPLLGNVRGKENKIVTSEDMS